MTRPVWATVAASLLLLAPWSGIAQQATPRETTEQELLRLTQAVAQAQAQVDASQQQLLELKKALAALEQRVSFERRGASSPGGDAVVSTASSQPTETQPVQERQAMQESQIATLDQVKVETDSKYPVKVTGLLLLNGFVNTGQVDLPVSPTAAVAGGGSTGASLRQTILGFDARGPRIAGAASHADLRVDFFGTSASNGVQTGYGNAGGLLRLRTAHMTLDWKHTQIFAEMDRPILSPNAATSLVSVAEPALAWSGNLWVWAPQIGVTQTMGLKASHRIAFEAALVDVPDPPTLQAAPTDLVSQGERSRWPGSMFHVGLLGKEDGTGAAIGVGSYFGPHRTFGGTRFNSWAATMDFRVPLSLGLEMSGSVYRGRGLGGLGGGAYKDYVYGDGSLHSLDDVGGWAQLKKRAGPRLEFNAAFGMDNAFASEMRPYVSASTATYQNLARNLTFFANTIYSPSAYLLFSLEVRHIATNPVIGIGANSTVVGIGAGYKF